MSFILHRMIFNFYIITLSCFFLSLLVKYLITLNDLYIVVFNDLVNILDILEALKQTIVLQFHYITNHALMVMFINDDDVFIDYFNYIIQKNYYFNYCYCYLLHKITLYFVIITNYFINDLKELSFFFYVFVFINFFHKHYFVLMKELYQKKDTTMLIIIYCFHSINFYYKLFSSNYIN